MRAVLCVVKERNEGSNQNRGLQKREMYSVMYMYV